MNRKLLLAALLALAACTRTYYKDFAVEPQDRAYAARAQFADIKGYVVARGLRIITESDAFLAVELEPGDELRARLAGAAVELTLVRRSSGADFSAAQVKLFQQALESRLREATGQMVTIRLVGERTAPVSNVKFQ